MPQTILLTGVTGFIGSHTTIQLLERGYHVIGTLRNLARKDQILGIIEKHTAQVANLSFAEIDLLDPIEKWESTMQGVDCMLHMASPVPTKIPKNELDIIEPAKKGTLNVLQAATNQNIKRVVITSSIGAVIYGVRKHGAFHEKDWTNPLNYKDTNAYFRSKTLAEKAAWEFIVNTPGAPELVTILPGLVLGPVLERDIGPSANLVKRLLDGSTPAVPQISYDLVDVRSVADLHIKAMAAPAAAGNRYLCSNGYWEFIEIALLLKKRYPNRRIPKYKLPNFLVKFMANFIPEIKLVMMDLGTRRWMDAAKAKEELGWNPIPVKQAILDCAESLIEYEVV